MYTVHCTVFTGIGSEQCTLYSVYYALKVETMGGSPGALRLNQLAQFAQEVLLSLHPSAAEIPRHTANTWLLLLLFLLYRCYTILDNFIIRLPQKM